MSAGPRSKELYRKACALMPAGVNSPVRAFRSVGGEPLFYASASGCRFADADGRTFVDYCCSWGPLILGHADPDVVEAVSTTAAKGLSYGAPCAEEVDLAELVLGAVEHLGMVRFVSSGTEAVMSAIRLARGVTGRDAIVKFSGCYHGHVDSLLVSAGSGLATFGLPSSAGVPKSFVEHTLVVPLDDPDAFEQVIDEHGDEIAAVIIEPLPANNGLLEQRPGFLQLVRDRTEQAGALLIFDEVINGFRLAPGGAAERYGVTPDLATYGKIIGGGMPVGAYGGRRDLMERIAPLGPVYQAGTLSGNPVAMAAGAATLRRLLADDGAAYARLEELGARLQAGLEEVFARRSAPWRVVRAGSIAWLSLSPDEPPRSAEAIPAESADVYARLHRALLARGVYLAPSAYEVAFVSTAHDEEAIALTLEAFDGAVGEVLG